MDQDRSWTEIDLDNFKYNINQLSRLTGGKSVMQIVKADAYGHGAYQIAKTAEQAGVSMLGVANADEGMMLRYQGIKLPILILSPSFKEEIDLIIKFNLIASLSNLSFAKYLSNVAQKENMIVKVHLNVDTGMGRNGISYREFKNFYNQIHSYSNLEINGIFSHYSSSENDPEFTQIQFNRFKQILEEIERKPEYIHIANSTGVVTNPDEFTNLVRIGLLSYGVYSHPDLKEKVDLKPVMTFKSKVSVVKSAQNGDFIGYNKTYEVNEKLIYGILPIGYADGYDYLLSNKGFVLINNIHCKILGKISMDMIAVDLSKIDSPRVGMPVILIGDDNTDMRVENITSIYNGSPYEMLCQIGRRAKRYYKMEGEIINSSPLLRRDFVSTDYSSLELNRVIETAIEQRLQSKEIADLVYDNILKQLFYESDKDVSYRYKFKHTVEFLKPVSNRPDYYRVYTQLSYKKTLKNNFFIVACANSEEKLEKYFNRYDVEYRWLLPSLKTNIHEDFKLISVKVNDISLSYEKTISNGCLELKCYNSSLEEFINSDVDFVIETETIYPINTHQLSIYINEMTKGIDIEFIHNNLFKQIEITPILSGRIKFPNVIRSKNKIQVKTHPEKWIIPNSGIVFSY